MAGLRLERVRITGFRCIDELDLIDPTTGQPMGFAAIVGPNGSGKTAILEAIALGLVAIARAGRANVSGHPASLVLKISGHNFE